LEISKNQNRQKLELENQEVGKNKQNLLIIGGCFFQSDSIL